MSGGFALIEGDVTLYDSAGIELAVEDATALPANTRGFIGVGYDGTNTRFIRVDSNGHQYVVSNQLPAALVGGRLDTNVGAWLGSTTPTVGQKVMAASVPVVVSSDQSAIPVSQSGTWTVQQGTPPWTVEGTDPDGSPPTENPVLTAGYDGTNVQTKLTDTAGRQRIVGAGSDGSPPVSDPVLLAGWDGTNVETLKTNSAGRVEEVLYDGAGNPVGVVLDGTLYRLQVDAKVAKGDDTSDLVHLDAIDTDTGVGRLKATIYSPGGDPVAFSSVSSAVNNDFAKNGGSPDLLVDGSVTPVKFSYAADATYDISVQEIHFTLVSNSVTFGSDYFGATSGPLTNGLLVQAVVNGGTTVNLYNMVQNESFVNFASPGGFTWIVSSKDLMSSAYVVGGGLVLKAGTSDEISVTVRDDIDSCGVYFRCYVKGNLLAV